jgi:hypothetical protein
LLTIQTYGGRITRKRGEKDKEEAIYDLGRKWDTGN